MTTTTNFTLSLSKEQYANSPRSVVANLKHEDVFYTYFMGQGAFFQVQDTIQGYIDLYNELHRCGFDAVFDKEALKSRLEWEGEVNMTEFDSIDTEELGEITQIDTNSIVTVEGRKYKIVVNVVDGKLEVKALPFHHVIID